MKCLLFALFLTHNILLTMDPITLAPKKEIYEHLYNLGWQHFLKKTKIHKGLVFKHECPDQIVQYIKITIQDYNENHAIAFPKKYKNYSTAPLTDNDQLNIIAAIFKNHPHVIIFLKKNNSLK